MELPNLEKLRERSKKVNKSLIDRVFTAIMLRDKEDVVVFIKERWKRGLRPDGKSIGEYAWASYEMFKRQSNPLADGRVDLFDTGALSEGLNLHPKGNGAFSIFSSDEKFLIIVSRYGLDVFALTAEEEEAVIGVIASKTNIALHDYVMKNKPLPI